MKAKKWLSLFLCLAICFSLFAFPVSATETDDVAADDKYASLIFDAEEAYYGDFTYDGTLDGETVIEGGLKTKAYRVSYVANPPSDDILLPCRRVGGEHPAGDFFKMNIIVPESYDGKKFTEEELANAPILIYTPWGGDSGAVVGDLSTVSVRGDREALRIALSKGWIVIDPGMVGANQLTGVYGEDYNVYGKLPYPIACMKAVIRYLRYDTNAETIPGNKERIFFLGNSSGGDMAAVIGASGNSSLFEPFLEEMGAAPGRDDVFCALPSCPVMMRNTGDNGLAWQLYGDISGDETALEINQVLSGDYIEYLDSLGLKAEMDVPEAGIKAGDALTAENFKDYILVYYKQSAVRYLNSLGGEDAINEYLASELDGGMYWRGLTLGRDVLKPVIEDGVVVDLDNTWDELMNYIVCGGDGTNPAVELNWQYDHPMMCETILENGLLAESDGSYRNGSSASFGKSGDYAAVFSETGQNWIQEKFGVTISEEYDALIELQRNSTDPMYFIKGEGATDEVTVAPYWHMRTGAIDFVVPSPNFIGLAVALENQGADVDAAFMWDEGHQLTSDVADLFEFAEAALEEADAAEAEPVDLTFDAETAYQGQYELTVDEQVVVFDVYQATYASKPITGLTWGRAASEDYFKLNISVPVSVDGVECGDMSDAPILMYNPWGGDSGSAVREPGSIGVRQSQMALARGYVVVEPGMRGHNCFVGTYDNDDFYNYGKLPYPLVDLKAAIRYLRYDTNAETIPGNKDLIFFAGTSSGGDATVMIASSANNPLFDPYLEEIGAADTSDAVFAASPSCPVMTRQWADAAIAWERWGVIGEDDAGANEINRLYTEVYAEYQDGLGLTATFAVPDAGIAVGDKLTSENYQDYLLVYVKQSAIRYLNSLGGEEAVNEYLASVKGGDMYGHPESTRTWVNPVYDDNGVVVDVDFTWEDYWAYYVGDQDGVDTGDGHMDTSMLLNMQYDKTILAPDDVMEGNSVVNSGAGTSAFGSPYANASSFSFGKATDLAMTFSVAGFEYLETLRDTPVTLDAEYAELVELQANCTDPLYFIIGDGAAGSDTCEYWFIRTGGIDLVTPLPVIFNLATALENNDYTVDAALVWDQSHGLTNDLEAFFDFADEAIAEYEAGEPAVEVEAQPTNDAVMVDGEAIPSVSIYKINDYNYFKLRDIAEALKPTSKQFSVTFDEAARTVYITTGEGYASAGDELTGAVEAAVAVESDWTLIVDGVEQPISVYSINGYNYYKLRDLGAVLGFDVGYEDSTAHIYTI